MQLMIPAKYQNWDKITVSLDTQLKISEWWKLQDIETVENIPFNKGVIVCKDAVQTERGKFDAYLVFELLAEHIKLQEFYGFNNRRGASWELMYEGSVIDGANNFNITYDRPYHVSKQRMLDLTMIFMGIVNFIVHFKEERSIIGTRFLGQTQVRKGKKGKPKSRSVQYVPTKIYEVKNVPDLEQAKQERDRITESWAVRGHPRHYKSGKVIWIKPYVKGDKNSVEPKEYRVTDFDNKENQDLRTGE